MQRIVDRNRPKAMWLRAGAVAVAVAMGSGCASNAVRSETRSANTAALPVTPPLKIDLLLDPDLAKPALSAWLIYAAGVASVRKEAFAHGRPADLFAEEVAGRSGLVIAYHSGAKDSDPYLETIAAVAQAGFLREYVLAYFALPGWTISATDAATLNTSGFEAWGREHLQRHEPSTHARVRTDPDPAATPPPGADLMRGVSLNAATECPGLMSELVKRASQWDSIEASLGGRTALSLRRRADLFRALGNPEVSARAKAHGVVFVSPRVSELIRTAGFCAIETHDLEAAERFIKQLIAIDPTDERAAGELAHVYVSEKRWDAALAQIEHALKTTVDPCNQAILWRKKGYVFTEQRSLTEARRAYLRSLELDPGNDLAVNELRLLGRLAGNSGGSEPPTSMPPSTSSTTSGCRAQ